MLYERDSCQKKPTNKSHLKLMCLGHCEKSCVARNFTSIRCFLTSPVETVELEYYAHNTEFERNCG